MAPAPSPDPRAHPSGAAPRRRPAWALEFANLLSGAGNSLVLIALPWLVLERTGSAARAGAVAAAGGIAIVVASPLVGTAVDRLGRRTVSIASDLVSLTAVLAYPVLDRTVGLALPTIVVLAVVGAAFDPAAYTARKALVPEVARASGMPVTQLTGIHEGVYLAGWTLGPVLGAWAIASLGAADALGAAALAFLGAVVAMVALGHVEGVGADDAVAVPPGLRAVREGARLLARDRVLATLTVVLMAFLLLYLPTESVLLPVHFEARGEPAGLGITISALAAGAALGSFGFGALSRRASRRTIARAAVTVTTVAVALMATLPPLPLMALAGFLLGLGWGPLEPLLTTLVQERVPAAAHGRVFGLQLALYSALPPLGQWAAGEAAERFGVGATYRGVAVLFAATAAVVITLRTLAELDAPAHHPGADAQASVRPAAGD